LASPLNIDAAEGAFGDYGKIAVVFFVRKSSGSNFKLKRLLANDPP
jgi:hypothetical protein